MVGEVSRDTAAFAGVALLACAAPFEATMPLLRLPMQSVSNLEAAVALACLLGAAAVLARGIYRPATTPLAAPWLAFLGACAIAAGVSPVSRVNAFHMTGRAAAALAVYVVTIAAAQTPARARRIAELLVAGGVAVAALAMLEFLNVAAVLRLLTAFRPGITTVGAQLRAGGSLQYPTIASMYLEVVFALGVGLLLAAVDRSDRRRAALIVVALLAIAEAIVLTFTRAGLIGMAVVLLGAMAARYRRRHPDIAIRALAGLAVAVVGLFALSRSSDSLWLRMTSEGQEAWYRADIDSPRRVTLAAGDVAAVPVKVTNTGRLVWDSTEQPPFYFSYHWLSPAGDRVVAFDGVRTPFDSAVRPGETATVVAYVRAPQRSGSYRLEWDVVQEGRLWFSTEPGASVAASDAQVNGSTRRSVLSTAPLPRPTVRPGRLQLWRAALAIVVAHPLVGIGLDNFRLAYGAYAGIATPDLRTHSNNMYLEVLAGTGLLGAAAFAWLLWRISRSVDQAHLGALCGLAAIAVHGFFDSFLGFAPTYVLFGMTVGLACARPHVVEIGSDAYRV